MRTYRILAASLALLLFSSDQVASQDAPHVALLTSIQLGEVLRVRLTALLLLGQFLSGNRCMYDW